MKNVKNLETKVITYWLNNSWPEKTSYITIQIRVMLEMVIVVFSLENT